MTTTRVLLPVLKGKIFFVVDKGRHWSVVEHMLLEALVRSQWTTEDLSREGQLPRRVVIECIVRLMRAGWVELAIDGGAVKFRGTRLGAAAVANVDLPRLADLRRRPTNYILDTVCGEIFRNKDLVTQSEEDIKKNLGSEPSVWIQPRSWHSAVDVNEALDVLLDADETFVSGQPGGIYRRWVSVSVRDGVIVSGLPDARPLADLRRVVLDAAAAAGNEANVTVEPEETFEPSGSLDSRPAVHHGPFSMADLVLGGQRHRETIEFFLENAQSKLFIHSTFIHASRVEALLSDMERAIGRGVQIHIFWGQNDDMDEQVSTREAIATLRKNVRVQSLSEGLFFHPFSTGSHAKLLLADAGESGAYIAAVGSCNWLTSAFTAYEASVIVRHPHAVREIAGHFARLVCMHDGMWSDLASDMVRIGLALGDHVVADDVGSARISVVVGAQHNDFILRARDEAERFILLASHRLGVASRPGVLVPLQRAAADKQVQVHVFYCRRTAPVRAADERKITAEAITGGIELTPVQSPRIHAKLLVWDDSNVLITSLNWLSADQVHMAGLGEIGLYVCAEGAGTAVSDHFNSEIGRSNL